MAYFHILVESKEKISRGKNHDVIKEFILDIPEHEKAVRLVRDIVLKYITKQEFYVSGRVFTKDTVAKMLITKTEETSDVLLTQFYNKLTPGVLMIVGRKDVVFSSDRYDATNEILSEAYTMANETNTEIPETGIETKKDSSQRTVHQTIHAHTAIFQTNSNNSSQSVAIVEDNDSIFKRLLNAAESINDPAIINAITEMQSATLQKNKPTFLEHYKEFMQLAAAHMDVFGPLLPTLASIL